jgi:hypothetical protein
MSDTTFRTESYRSPLIQGLSGRKLHAAWAILDRARKSERLKASGQTTKHSSAATLAGLPRKRKHKGWL